MKKYRSNSKSKSAIMKHFILTAIFAAMCQHGAAQTTEEVATGLDDPKDIHLIGANLYVAEQEGRKISKIDLGMEEIATQFTETGADAEATFNDPSALSSIGNDLYVGLGISLNKVLKMDISNTPSPSIVDVALGVNFLGIVDIVFDGNTLYSTSQNLNKIVKIDNVTAVSPTISDFITGITTPRGLLLNGTDLYVTNSGKLSKINLTAETPVAMDILTGLRLPGYMVLDGNNLYISERGTGKVLTIDITETRPIKTEVLTGLLAPQGLAISNGYLYIAHGGIETDAIGKIVKYPVSPTVHQGDFTLDTQDKINGILESNFIGFTNLIIKESTPGNIISLTGLANITSIGGNLEIVGNASLTSLAGLESLATLGGKLYIGVTAEDSTADGNAALIDFCTISSFVTGGIAAQITEATEYFVANNAYDPTYAGLGNAAGTCTSTKAGNVVLGSQNNINDLASSFTRIAGNLIVSSTDANDITSLTSLSNIISIGGNLEIVGNASLTSLAGLEDLAVLEGKLYIGVTAAGVSNANAALVNYCAISSLVTGTAQIIDTEDATDEYFVANNAYNPTYAALGNTDAGLLGNMATCSNVISTSITLNTQEAINTIAAGFTRIEMDLKIEETDTGTITSLLGLSKITSIGGNLEIIGTTALVNLVGLNNITTLEGNLYIGVTAADALDGNTALINFCEISGLVTGDPAEILETEYFIANNAYDPSYTGLAIGTAASTNGGVDGCREFGAVVSTNTFSKDSYRLFPNPVKDILFIKSDSEITSISISNVSGQTVLKGKGGNIDVRNLSKGIYFAKIISGEKVTVEKFIKM